MEEVEALVEGYQELAPSAKPFIRVRLLDLRRSYPHLPAPEKEAILLHGVSDLTLADIKARTGSPTRTTWSRYRSGLRRLTWLLNTGGRWHHSSTQQRSTSSLRRRG